MKLLGQNCGACGVDTSKMPLSIILGRGQCRYRNSKFRGKFPHLRKADNITCCKKCYGVWFRGRSNE